MKDEELEELDNMIQSGEVRASCPSCQTILESVFQKKCTNCKNKIDIDEIPLMVIDWSNAN